MGLIFGIREGLDKINPGFHLPQFLPLGWPTKADFTFALFALVVPQIPMTLGNAVMAYADLSKHYFGDSSKRVTYKSACISMALANLVSSTIIDLNSYKVWGSDPSQNSVDGKISIREKGKRNIICLPEYLYFIGRVSHADAYQFDFIFQVGILFYHTI